MKNEPSHTTTVSYEATPGAAWNQLSSRRRFLKQAGGAGLAVTIASGTLLAPRKAASQASGSVITFLKVFEERIFLGDFTTSIADVFYGGLPTDVQLAAYLNANPAAISAPSALGIPGGIMNVNLIGSVVIMQGYLESNPSLPAGAPDVTHEIGTVAAFQVTNISRDATTGKIHFNVGAAKYRRREIFDWIGTKVGAEVRAQVPQDPNYPSFP
jgi:hypothetical protein